MTEPIRVLIADDHPIYREGLARTLADAEDIEVVGTASDGEEAALQAEALRPDLVLLDLSMPKGGGMAALVRIAAMDPAPRVAMVTASEEEDDLMRALKGGASGYVLKGIGADDLVAVVRDLAAGRSYVSPGLAGRVLAAMRAKPASPPEDPLSVLSKREEDILTLVAQGKSNKEVGRMLDLQEKTVKHYMTSILQKLHLRNRVEAAVMMRERRKV